MSCGGIGLVAVLHAASVLGFWRRVAGAVSLRTAPGALWTPPTHLMMLAASRTSSTRHRHSYQRRTRRTPPTPDDASRMQYRHKTCATSPGPGPIVIKNIYHNTTHTHPEKNLTRTPRACRGTLAHSIIHTQNIANGRPAPVELKAREAEPRGGRTKKRKKKKD